MAKGFKSEIKKIDSKKATTPKYIETYALRIDYAGTKFDHIELEDIGSISVEIHGKELVLTLKTKIHQDDYDEFEDDYGEPTADENGYRTEVICGVTNICIEKGFKEDE